MSKHCSKSFGRILRILAGLAFIGLAEVCRRFSWIAPEWIGLSSLEVISAGLVMLMLVFFALGGALICEVVEECREARRDRRSRRAKKDKAQRREDCEALAKAWASGEFDPDPR